jgi:hypothetical protein
MTGALAARGSAEGSLPRRCCAHSRRILDDRAMRWLYPCPIEGAAFQCPFSHRGPLPRGRSQQFFVTGAASHLGNKFGQMGVDPARELHLYFFAFGAVAAANIIAVVAIAAMDKARQEPFLAAMARPNVPK